MNIANASSTYSVKLTSHQEVAEQTMAFCFDKPATFRFTPGQFIELTLLTPPESDTGSNSRAFSIASAPYEDSIMAATRLRDTAFKRVLSHLPLGTEVRVDGPYGNLKLHHDESRAAVVLTGGIGITPFRSILLSAAKKKLVLAHFSLLREPASGGCRVSRRTSGPGEAEPQLPIDCLHARDGEIASLLAG
jgi:ferredoxin-NADP reductase